MKSLKTILIYSIIIFIINFPAHFIYDFLPNFLTSLIFPINESIFEHLKMIFTSFFIFYIFLFLTKRKKDSNVFLINLLSSIFCICLFLVIYLPLYKAIGENLIITIILLFITIFISQSITYFIYDIKYKKIINIICFTLIISILTLNAFLTYHPLNNPLFINPQINDSN